MGDRGFEWKSIEYVLTPEEGTVNVTRNWWWAVNKDGDVLFWYGHQKGDVGTPQANRDERIVRRLASRNPEVTDVIQIPLAFYPVNLGDY